MQRISLVFATIILVIACALPALAARAAAQEEDKKAAEHVVLAFERAVQEFDFDKADSLVTPDARWIEESYPHPVEPALRQDFQPFKDANMRIDNRPRDTVANVRGDVAWVTVTLESIWKADTPTARAMLGSSEWHVIYVAGKSARQRILRTKEADI